MDNYQELRKANILSCYIDSDLTKSYSHKYIEKRVGKDGKVKYIYDTNSNDVYTYKGTDTLVNKLQI